MRVLLTGGTGFLGSHVAERLLAAGHHVRALVRPTSDTRRLAALGVERVEGALDAPERLAAAVRGVEGIVHCAGAVKALDEAGFDRVNAAGTVRLLAAAEAVAPDLRRFVYVSSIAAGGPGGPARERGPVSAYGRSKRRGEDVARRAPFSVAVIRPPVIYGPRDREVLPAFRAARRIGVLPVLGGRGDRFSMIHVADCAGAIVAALGGRVSAVYPVDDGVVHTWSGLAAAMAGAVGRRRVRLVHVPRPITGALGHLGAAAARLRGRPIMLTADKVAELSEPDWVSGHDAITRDLGWRPAIPLAEGLAETCAWYRREGWL